MTPIWGWELSPTIRFTEDIDDPPECNVDRIPLARRSEHVEMRVAALDQPRPGDRQELLVNRVVLPPWRADSFEERLRMPSPDDPPGVIAVLHSLACHPSASATAAESTSTGTRTFRLLTRQT